MAAVRGPSRGRREVHNATVARLWFDGREDVARFLAERLFATAWRLVPIRGNGKPAFASTAKFRVGHLMRKFAVHRRAEAVYAATRLHLI